jgi:hypothetical protein
MFHSQLRLQVIVFAMVILFDHSLTEGPVLLAGCPIDGQNRHA